MRLDWFELPCEKLKISHLLQNEKISRCKQEPFSLESKV